jgi:ERCC4-type nuclease
MHVVSVDFREGDSPVARALAARPGFRVVSARLRSGDYALGGRIGVERKSGPDLGASLIDGRLFRQAAALAGRYSRPLIVAEGLRLGAPSGGVSWPCVRGALVSLSSVFRIPVLFSSGPDETADLVALAAEQLRRSFEAGYARPGWRPRGIDARRCFVLQGFPGVGPQRARSLLDRFGSLESIFQADARELRDAPGIGRTVARGIVEILRGAPSSTSNRPIAGGGPPGAPSTRGW